MTVWDGGQLEGDSSRGQSEWQGTSILWLKHLDEYSFDFMYDPQETLQVVSFRNSLLFLR